MWNAALTILGVGMMLEAIFILALFPKVVEVRYIPVGIDQRTGDIIMKKDIDYT